MWRLGPGHQPCAVGKLYPSEFRFLKCQVRRADQLSLPEIPELALYPHNNLGMIQLMWEKRWDEIPFSLPFLFVFICIFFLFPKGKK